MHTCNSTTLSVWQLNLRPFSQQEHFKASCVRQVPSKASKPYKKDSFTHTHCPIAHTLSFCQQLPTLPKLQNYKQQSVPTNLWEQPIGSLNLVFPQSLWEQLFPQICQNNQQGTNFLFPQSLWEQRCSHKGCGNTMWFLLSGKEKVIYQMKKLDKVIVTVTSGAADCR